MLRQLLLCLLLFLQSLSKLALLLLLLLFRQLLLNVVGHLLRLDDGLFLFLLLLHLLLLPLLFFRFFLFFDFFLLESLSCSERLQLLQFILLTYVLLFHHGGVACLYQRLLLFKLLLLNLRLRYFKLHLRLERLIFLPVFLIL